MSLRIKKSLNKRHIEEIQREPNKKIFIVCEGERTEIKYFEGIRDHSKTLGINNLLQIVIMDKTPEFKGTSNPNGLIALAKDTIEKFNCNDNQTYEDKTYDEKRDKFLIVIDRDKNDFFNYKEFIDNYKEDFILGITNPCFELWLLLHKNDSVNNIIKPNYEEILENKKISNNHNVISEIVSKEYHMNPKSGMNFNKFKDSLFYAIEQEKKLEQDLYNLDNKIGSNIGEIIKKEML